MTSMPNGVRTHHGNVYCSLPGGVRAHHGLFKVRAFETPATFHIVAKNHKTVQWFIQANQKIIDVTTSISSSKVHTRQAKQIEWLIIIWE